MLISAGPNQGTGNDFDSVVILGDNSSISDDRLKINEVLFLNSKNILKKINFYIYDKCYLFSENFNNTFKEFGVIAQEILEIEELKHIVIEDKYYTVKYQDLFVLNMAATKDLVQDNEDLKSDLDTANSKIINLENELSNQKELINNLVKRIEVLENS